MNHSFLLDDMSKLLKFIHNIISTIFMIHDSLWIIFSNFNMMNYIVTKVTSF